MNYHKVILYSCKYVPFTVATIALKKIMNLNFFDAHRLCKEADQMGSSVLCITSSQKARDYVLQLEEHSLIAEQITI